MYPNRKIPYRGIFVKYEMEELQTLGVDIIKVVKTNYSRLDYIPFFIKVFFKTLVLDYDVIHAHYTPHSTLLPALLKSIKKKPFVITFHGSDLYILPFKNKLLFSAFKYVVSKADKIIVRSAPMKRMIEEMKIPPSKIAVIGAGVDTSIFYPRNKNKMREMLKIPKNKKIVLFVGRLSHRKGIELIYSCAKKMPSVLFIIIGNGPIKENIRNCLFTGAKSHEEIPMWMAAADIFVLPSYSEGLPNALMEALSTGIPAIVTEIPGNLELVRDGETGFIVPVGDVNAIKEKISYLIKNEDILKRMGKEARKDMIEKYDRKKLIRELKEIYEELVN